MREINVSLLSSFLLIVISTYIFEVIYNLPSPAGDGAQFLKVTFNICRYDTVTLYGSDKWTHHGWLPWYLKSKLNLNCQYSFVFLFNFLVKLITLFFSYLFLKDKINKNYVFIILFFIFVIQLKLQFRPENFALMLTSIIFYLNNKNYYKFVPIFFGLLLYSHFIFFCFLTLFFIIYFYRTYLNLKIFIESVFIFVFTLFILDLIYPYSLINYLEGNIIQNSNTWTKGASFDIWLFIEYYVITKIHGGGFLPLWGIIFFLVIFVLLKKNKLFFFSIPFLYYFSLRNIPGNYYMIGLTPVLLYLSIYFDKKNNFEKSKIINILFSLILLITIVGYSHYFARNILTIKYFKNDYENTLSFINNNLDEIDKVPSFGFLLNDKIKLESYKIRSCQNCNNSNTKKKYNLTEVNGTKNPCPDDISNNKDFSIKLFGKKIFNSNSGYGIYICKIN